MSMTEEKRKKLNKVNKNRVDENEMEQRRRKIDNVIYNKQLS